VFPVRYELNFYIVFTKNDGVVHDSQSHERKNMVMSPAGFGKAQQQSLLPDYQLDIDFDDRSGTSSLNFET
jgi:hypothetical protein